MRVDACQLGVCGIRLEADDSGIRVEMGCVSHRDSDVRAEVPDEPRRRRRQVRLDGERKPDHLSIGRPWAQEYLGTAKWPHADSARLSAASPLRRVREQPEGSKALAVRRQPAYIRILLQPAQAASRLRGDRVLEPDLA